MEQGVEFGSFRLFPAKRLLETNGTPVAVGSRALDILILLVEREGEVVSKKELLAHAWPDITVDESSLRVHIAGLRKSLSEDGGGANYIKNVPGRGYCFVEPTTRLEPARQPEPDPGTRRDHIPALPPQLGRMVGRDETVRKISELLEAKRFVTSTAPAALGKRRRQFPWVMPSLPPSPARFISLIWASSAKHASCRVRWHRYSACPSNPAIRRRACSRS